MKYSTLLIICALGIGIARSFDVGPEYGDDDQVFTFQSDKIEYEHDGDGSHSGLAIREYEHDGALPYVRLDTYEHQHIDAVFHPALTTYEYEHDGAVVFGRATSSDSEPLPAVVAHPTSTDAKLQQYNHGSSTVDQKIGNTLREIL